MNFLKVAGRDISSIFKNRFIRVSVIAIIIVPLLYSLLYLDAFWDPYTRIKDMPVAVVNQDKGSIKDGEKVNYGQDLIDKLKDKQEVGWRFVTKEQAETGVKGKDYYAMFVIPENFSENALSSTKGKPEQAKILYSANEKRNFLAAQINGKVLDQLKAELTKSMSKEYTTAVFDSLYEVKDGMKKASDGSKELADGLVTAKDGASQLRKDGTSQLKDGLGQLNGKVPELADGVGKLLVGSNTLTSKLGELKAQVPAMVNGVGQLNEAYKTQIVPSTGKLKDGASQLALGLGAAKGGVTQLSDAATQLNQGGALLTEGSGKLDAGYGQMKPGITALKDGSLQVAGGVDALIDNTKKSQMALQQAVTAQLGAYLAANPVAMKDPNMQGFLATLDTLNKASTDATNLAMINALQTGAHNVAAGAEKLEQGSTAFVEGSQKYAESTVAFAKGADQFAKGAGSFAEKTGTAVVAAAQISGGLDKLYAAMSGDFANGLSQLNDKMPALADGAPKLSAGSSEITAGLSTLNGKLPELKDGVSKLYDGSNKVDDNMQKLSEGIIKLSDGSKELNEKLTDGYNDLNSNLKNDSETMGAAFSEPVVIDQEAINPVKTYGEGFTPYFIPLSLWVGAIMMFFVITDKVDEDITAKPGAIVAGKFLSYGFIGLIQATLASGVVLLLGLRPNSLVLYFLFNIFLSYVFIAIIQCLIFLLGQVGRLLSIVLLILQLTSCAGTFPLEVVPKFFKILNPFMPFTYAVSGLREVISGVDYVVFTKDVTVLAAALFVFLFISILMKGHADKAQRLIQDRKDQAANTVA